MGNYPNLEAELKADHRSISSMARRINVTPELLLEAVKGNEKLSLEEFSELCCCLSCSNYKYLLSPKLSIISKRKNNHRRWIKGLDDMFKIIEKAYRNGNSKAKFFVEQDVYGKKYIDFGIKILYDKEISYAEYRRLKEEMESVLYEIHQEGQIKTPPRGLHRKTPAPTKVTGAKQN